MKFTLLSPGGHDVVNRTVTIDWANYEDEMRELILSTFDVPNQHMVMREVYGTNNDNGHNVAVFEVNFYAWS